MSHVSVMLSDVLRNLNPKDGEVYLDGTFGAGGYTKAILDSAKCKVFAIDRDETAKNFAQSVSEKYGDRFVFLSGKFSESEKLLKTKDVEELDGMVFDIGVSSMQLDSKERGFSFDSDAKLDMRMDQKSFPSAFEIVNQSSEKELAQIIKDFGDEPKARQIAKKIVDARNAKPITSCRELAEIVRSLYRGYSKTDPATRTFQAFRIAVNQELDELKIALKSSLKLLKVGGRLVVVSFHSLEDAIVKNFLKEESGLSQTFSRYQPLTSESQAQKKFHILTKSAVSPSDEEVAANPRARSAKMRVAIRI